MKYLTIAFSFGCRVLQIGSSLVVVRSLVPMLGVEQYGVWVTLVSVLAWMSLFDFGVGYGIKNRISEYTATGRAESMQRIVSAAAIFYALAAVALLLCFSVGGLFFQPFATYRIPALLLFIGSSVAFFFSLGGIILQGLGLFKAFYAMSLLQPLAWLLLVSLGKEGHWSLEKCATMYVIAMAVQSAVIMSWGIKSAGGIRWLGFSDSYREIRGQLKTGIGFLLLQISNLALYMSGNFIIYNSLGAADAAKYDILNKIFQFFIVGFSIVVNIAWTEISKAKANGDHSKKKNIFWGLIGLTWLSVVVAVIFAYYSPELSSFLTKHQVVAERKTAFLFVPLILVQSLAYSGAVFLNAYEELRVQNVLAMISFPVFLIAAQLLLHAQIRLASIPLASAIATLPALFYCLFRGYRLAVGFQRRYVDR